MNPKDMESARVQTGANPRDAIRRPRSRAGGGMKMSGPAAGTRDLFRDQRGGVFVWMALSMVMFFALCAMGVDAAYLFLIRTELQATADAAAHAAAAALWPPGAAAPNLNGVTIAGTPYPGAIATAQSYAAKNMPVVTNGTVVLAGDVLTGNWGCVGGGCTKVWTVNLAPINAVRVTANRTAGHNNAVPAWFSTFLGRTSTDVVAQGTAAMQTGAKQWDLVIGNDISGSFSPEYTGARLAPKGDAALSNCLNSFTTGQSVIGLVAFTGDTIGAPTTTLPAGLNQCSNTNSDVHGCYTVVQGTSTTTCNPVTGSCTTTTTPNTYTTWKPQTDVIVPTSGVVLNGIDCTGANCGTMGTVSATNTTLLTAINADGSTTSTNSLKTCGSGTGTLACSGSDVTGGIVTSTQLLNNTAASHTAAGNPAFASSSVGQAMLLLTDGSPNCSSVPSGMTQSTCDAQLVQNAQFAAAAAGAAGYDVFLVFYPGNEGSQSIIDADIANLNAIVNANVTSAQAHGFEGRGKLLQTTNDPNSIPVAMFGACAQNIPLALVN
jgi:Flp pilus assembly protein TadG